jgi:redox-sensitive bicupin YhaK (pirin superfamily)
MWDFKKKRYLLFEMDHSNVTLHAVSGNWNGTEGAFKPLTDIHLSFIYFKEGGRFQVEVPKEQNVFLYIVKGELKINGDFAQIHHLVDFNHDGQVIEMKATTDAIILFGYATPFHEPFFAYGPFVMNTREEVEQAYEDMKNGKFGNAEDLMD